MSYLHELWLADFCGFEPEQIHKCIEIFKSAEEAFDAKPSQLRALERLGIGKGRKIRKTLEIAEDIAEIAQKRGIDIMTISDSDYPESLKNIYMPPRVLFIKGERINLNNYLPFTVVGTRRPTQNGRKIASLIASKLTSCGFLIVSGMAEGIDAAAGKGALSVGGKTIAVLAGGADIVYPAINQDLYDKIVKNGAIVSERPPGTIGKPYFYQQKNRIVAGLSKGTLVVEGKNPSGSALTAKHADENNRDLFAVPGSPLLPQSQLPNDLIATGAKIVRSPLDIIDTYASVYPELLGNGIKLISSQKEKNVPSFECNIDKTDKIIIDYIEKRGESVSPDEICEACRIQIGTVLSRLTILMLNGTLTQETGNKYSISGGLKS